MLEEEATTKKSAGTPLVFFTPVTLWNVFCREPAVFLVTPTSSILSPGTFSSEETGLSLNLKNQSNTERRLR